jgi:alkanesulfonate monooxygenase SsuD/methylene tetrahydromethanopterin reductase-like flavin-dependent oxidoreductase (luciferase family)
MEIGIGLPATIPGTDGESMIEWAQRAERRGFSSLGVIDRLVYPNYEPMISLAAAASVTQHIRLTTAILIAPLRVNSALLAKEAATLHHLSGGRLVLGMAIGGREDDFTGAGLQPKRRGAQLDHQLADMLDIWGGQQRGHAGGIGPALENGRPELIIGGHSRASYERSARFGDGWVMGGGTPDQFSDCLNSLREAWSANGRSDRPRTLSLCYFSLGDNARQQADWYLGDYYDWLGPEIKTAISQSAAVSANMVSDYVKAFSAAGCDELVMFPCSKDPGQVDLLAEALPSSV